MEDRSTEANGDSQKMPLQKSDLDDRNEARRSPPFARIATVADLLRRNELAKRAETEEQR
jgi:hypothetical protein